MRRANRRRTAVFSVLAIAWAGALFVLSMQTGTDSGALSAGVTERLLGWIIARGADAAAADHVASARISRALRCPDFLRAWRFSPCVERAGR